jgi:hypothetical protein
VGPVASSIATLLERAAAEDPEAIPYLAAYVRAQLEARPDPEAMTVIERHHPAAPEGDALRYASLRIGLMRLHEHALLAVGNDEILAADRMASSSRLAERARLAVPIVALAGLALLGLGAWAEQWICAALGLLVLLPLPLVRIVVAVIGHSADASYDADREHLAQAELRRDQELAYLTRARQTDDARWLAALVERHPLLDFEALGDARAKRSTDAYRS